MPQSRAKAIAEGRLDPVTMEAFNSIPSPIALALASCPGSDELRKKKKNEFSPTPITPLSMYGLRKESPKLPDTSLLFATPKGVPKPSSSPPSPFPMITSRKDTLRVFDASPLCSLPSSGDHNFTQSRDMKVQTTEMELATSITLSEVPRSSPGGELDDSSEASQLTVTYEQRISETQASVSKPTSTNDSTEVDPTFLEQLKSIAGCASKEPTGSSSTTSFVDQTPRPDQCENRCNNPFKRKSMEEASSNSFHLTVHKIRSSSAGRDEGPSEYHFAEVSTLSRLRKTPTDEKECETTTSAKEVDLASPSSIVLSQYADGVEETPSSSVLTEISLNFEAAEVSPDLVASGRLSSSPPGLPSPAGKLSVKSRFISISKSTSIAQNGSSRSRGVTKLKAKPPSPANPPGGGILRFFKPVS
ncbi:hypothetical protein R1sor_004834 [Riccia sorocarpa]|uniref:Uncharacterized protein n=1 Tax=Riccia sorocarpa TaxID=122646 RepID=A0ABD3HIE4_9MARC